MTLAMGSHMSARKGERFRGTGSGKAGMGRRVPRGLFFSLPFLFLFSDLFYNSNFWIPNAFKQVSKFL
jgi:hypothetical protein